jgi:hypothetical protein
MLRFVLCLALLFASPAQGHFSESTHVRDILLDDSAAGDTGVATVYLRVPLPLIFADVIVRADELGTPLDDPILYDEDTAFGMRYRVSVGEIADRAEAFSQRLETALTFRRGEAVQQVELMSFRLSPRRPDVLFENAAAAAEALAVPTTRIDPVFGDAIVEYVLRLPPGAGVLTVENALPEIDLPPEIIIDNHLTRDIGARQFRSTMTGQLMEPVEFPQRVGWLKGFLLGGWCTVAPGSAMCAR